MSRRVDWIVGVFVAVLLTGACASTGGGGAADVAAPAAADVKNETGENGLLTPAALAARFADAMGGEAAIRSHSSSTTKGKFGIPAMGMEGDVVAFAAAPDKLVTNIELGGMGSMSNGYNGEIGWSENPMTGPSLLEGAALDQVRAQSSFYGPLAYDDLFPKQETLELTEFAGESAYKTRFVTANGGETFFYFSEASGLLLGTEGMQESDMGSADVTVVFSDYREFDGVLQPATTTIKTQGMELQQTVKEVTFDDVEASAFEPPESIKSLLE
jgi:hypothetical protein